MDWPPVHKPFANPEPMRPGHSPSNFQPCPSRIDPYQHFVPLPNAEGLFLRRSQCYRLSYVRAWQETEPANSLRHRQMSPSRLTRCRAGIRSRADTQKDPGKEACANDAPCSAFPSWVQRRPGQRARDFSDTTYNHRDWFATGSACHQPDDQQGLRRQRK
jgi:hypothetical protein